MGFFAKKTFTGYREVQAVIPIRKPNIILNLKLNMIRI